MLRIRWLIVLCLVCVCVSSAWAGSGIASLDTAMETTDAAVGTAGYGLFIAGLVGFFMLLVAGHYYLGFGMVICMFLIGALVGDRSDIAGLVQLSLGAELSPQVLQSAPAPSIPAPPLRVLLP